MAERSLRWGTVQDDAAGVWDFDGRSFKPLTRERRGEPRSHTGPPRQFEEVCKYVVKLPGVDAVHAIAFPVASTK